MRYLPAVTALVVLHAMPAAGQDPPKPGDRVRITAPRIGLDRHIGVVHRLDAETITVDSTPIARDEVTRLDVYRGRRGHAGSGAIWGGVIVGGLFGVAAAAVCTDPFFDCDPAAGFAAGFLSGALAGAVVGAGIGALIRTDAWSDQTGAVGRPVVAVGSGRALAIGWSVGF
jgi:hypothetical protein